METVQEAPKPVLVDHKKRGRPPKIVPQVAVESNGKVADAVQPDHSRVPKPQKRLLEAKALFEYWQSVPEPERSAWFIAYVYRKYPICDIYQPFSKEELLEIEKKKRKRPESNCGQLSQPFDPDNWEQQVYERWGAGDYQIRLNDQHESVHDTVTECHIRGLRDWDKFPPVLQLNQVVLAEELNQPYIRWARLKGIKFPGDAGIEQEAREEQEVEMNSVVETMARQNEALTDKVIRIAENSGKSNGAPPVDATARGQLGAVETVVEGAKQAMGVMGGAMKQMMENQVKAADPQEHVRSAIEMAKMMVPPPGNGNSDLLKIMEMQMSAQREQAKQQLEQQEKSFTRLIESERENHKTVVQMLTARLDSLEKQRSEVPVTSDERALDGYLRLRRKFKEAEEEEGTGEDDEPAWMRFGSKVLDGIQGTMANLAAMRASQAPAVPVIPETAPVLPVAAAPAPAPPKDEQMDMRVKYAQTIHKPLIDALKAGRPGYDFAAAIIAEAGQGPYDFLANSGYNGVTQFLQAYPPLWQELISPPIGAPMVEKFIGEFLDREKVMGAIQMAKGQPQRKGPTVNQ